ncbi:LacI family DNA-binding transcriptional regulator [Candidatus Margulisiibacteriota bacterium]
MPKKIRLKDIARRLGLSPATVSQAFNNPKLINRQTRKQILELCEELGYIRKKHKKIRHNSIGIIAQSFYVALGGFYNHVTTGVLKHAKKIGLNTIISSLEQDEDTLPPMITKEIIDGLIIVGKLPREQILQIKQENIPLVLCGNPTPGVELHTVVPDGRAGIYEVTKHLIELGHRRIATITGGPAFHPITSDRLDGYRFALAEANIRLSDKYIAKADFYKLETVQPALEKLLKLDAPPTAIVCACDAIAYAVIKILKEKGLKVPKDISVTGFDDIPFPEFIEATKPQLTTAHVHLEQLGEVAVDVLLEIIENPAKSAYRHTMPTQLIVRQTTSAPKKS